MKYFVMSDIHGSIDTATLALKQFENLQCDKIIILGDILYHGPRNPLPEGYNPQALLTLLNQYKDKMIVVRGNCDSEVDQMVLEFPITSDTQTICFKNRNVYLSHGHIYNPDYLPKNIKENDAFMFGHIHLPIADKVNGVYILNPGSLTLPKQENPKSYGILTEDNFSIFQLEDNKIIKSIDF